MKIKTHQRHHLENKKAREKGPNWPNVVREIGAQSFAPPPPAAYVGPFLPFLPLPPLCKTRIVPAINKETTIIHMFSRLQFHF